MILHSLASTLHRPKLAWVSDILVVALAVSLPWSTAATSILLALWLLSWLFTFDPAALRHAVATPAGGAPVALFGLGALGMLWADVTWAERLTSMNNFANLLVIPMLIAQFRMSPSGHRVLTGLLFSITLLLPLSYLHGIWPFLPLLPAGQLPGVPVKDYLAQSAMFSVAMFILLERAVEAFRDARPLHGAVSVMLAGAFFANLLFVATARTALVATGLLLAVFCLRHATLKLAAAVCLAGGVIAGLAWASSPYLRGRAIGTIAEISNYRAQAETDSVGIRLAFWNTALQIVSESPVIGHGTGSIETAFRREIELGRSNLSQPTRNPHNQTFVVAIQLGMAGVALLYLMWFAHLLQFRGNNFLDWAGLVIVAQNVFSSLFNSHLFDFTHGWLYMVMVGVLAGTVQRERGETPAGVPGAEPRRA